MSWEAYAAFPLGSIFVLVSFLYYWFNFRNFKLKKLLEFKREIFQLKRDCHFLKQKKVVHDNNVDLFLEELKSSENKANPNKKTISLESINDFYRKQKKYKELKRREEFFSSCKERALELISDLDIYIMKYLGSSLKIVEKQKRKKNKKLGKKVDKKVVKTIKSTWEKELEDIKISCEELRNNDHLLTHSFSSFEEQCRKKLLSAKVVYDQK